MGFGFNKVDEAVVVEHRTGRVCSRTSINTTERVWEVGLAVRMDSVEGRSGFERNREKIDDANLTPLIRICSR